MASVGKLDAAEREPLIGSEGHTVDTLASEKLAVKKQTQPSTLRPIPFLPHGWLGTFGFVCLFARWH